MLLSLAAGAVATLVPALPSSAETSTYYGLALPPTSYVRSFYNYAITLHLIECARARVQGIHLARSEHDLLPER